MILRLRPRVRLALWVASVLLAVFCLLGYFALPPLVKGQLEERLSSITGRKVTVGEVHFNPFTLALSVKGFAMAEREGGGTLLAFQELYVNAAWTSIFRLALVADSVRLVEPRLRVVRNPDRSYNVQDLLEAAAAPAADPGNAGPPGFSLNNIELVGGQVEFDDRSEGARHSVTDLHLGLPFLSTLSYAAEIKVQPFLAGKLNGSPFGLRGETTPFKDGSATALRIDLDRVPLPRYLEYLPVSLPVRVPSAELSANLVVNFNLLKGRPERISVSGDVRLRKLVLQHRGGAPLAQVEELALGVDAIDLVARRADVRELRVSAPAVTLRRARDGRLDLPAIPSGTAPAAAAEKPWQVVVGMVQVSGGRVEINDEVPAKPVRLRLQDIALTVRELSNAPNAQASVAFSAGDGTGAKFGYQGALQAMPLKSTGKAQVAGLALRAYQPYLEGAAALEVRDGVLDASAQIDAVQADSAVEVRISGADATLRSLRLHHPEEKEPFLRAALVEVRGAAADLPARSLLLGSISARDTVLHVRREADGTLSLQKIARQGAESGEPPAPWQFLAERLSLERGGLRFEDRALREPAVQELQGITLDIEKLGNAAGSTGSLALRTGVNKTGRLQLKGAVGLNPPSARLHVEASALPLASLDSYVAEQADMRLAGGALSTQADVEFRQAGGEPRVLKVRGSAGINEFNLLEREAEQELLKWKSLRLSGLSADAAAPSLSVDEVALTGFYSRLIVHADGQLNLQKLRRPPAASAATPPPPESAPQLRVGRIALQGGDVDFTDLFIKPNVSTRLVGVAGAIGEMSPQKAGEVEIRARLDDAAPVEILGHVNPFGKDLDLKMDLSAKGIDLSTFTPYAAKYAGYGIEKGKLTMILQYEVREKKLSAQNNIVLDQLTFGERVDSPEATKLPVLLAVALLKDSNGVIDISLPISGSLEDPQFSVAGLVLQVIGNLIGKALTSPFALLGAAVGGGDELAFVEFAAGEARLDEAATRRLATLAKALGNRPALRLEIAGRADPARDAAALQRAAVERQVKVQKQRALGGSGRIEDLPLSAEEYAKYQPAAYGAAKIPNKPRNLIGMAKDVPAAEMEALMLAAVPVGDEDLRRLAAARAQQTRDWLVREGKLAPERAFLVAPRLGGDKALRAEFSLKR